MGGGISDLIRYTNAFKLLFYYYVILFIVFDICSTYFICNMLDVKRILKLYFILSENKKRNYYYYYYYYLYKCYSPLIDSSKWLYKDGLSRIWTHDHWFLFRLSNWLSSHVMSSTHTLIQLCTATPTSSLVLYHILFRLFAFVSRRDSFKRSFL